MYPSYYLASKFFLYRQSPTLFSSNTARGRLRLLHRQRLSDTNSVWGPARSPASRPDTKHSTIATGPPAPRPQTLVASPPHLPIHPFPQVSSLLAPFDLSKTTVLAAEVTADLLELLIVSRLQTFTCLNLDLCKWKIVFDMKRGQNLSCLGTSPESFQTKLVKNPNDNVYVKVYSPTQKLNHCY